MDPTTCDERYLNVWMAAKDVLDIVLDFEPSRRDIDNFKELAYKFGSLYEKVFGRPDVTPYIHLLTRHTHKTLAIYGSIGKFGNWAAESLHSEVKSTVLNNSPRSGGGARNLGPAKYALQSHRISHVLKEDGKFVGPKRLWKKKEIGPQKKRKLLTPDITKAGPNPKL